MYKRIIAIVISIMIISLSITFIFKSPEKYSENENRYLSNFPKFSFNNLVKGKYMNDLENYFKDQFPLRDTFMGIKTTFDKLTLKTKINGVYLGKNNYLIEQFNGLNNSDKIINILNKFYENNNYINLNLMLVPTSIEINKDKLPSFVDSSPQVEVINKIYSEINFNTIDVYKTLVENNKKYQMFYYLDHHWTTYGAYFAYVEYSKNNGIIPLDMTNFEIEEVSNSFYGTLYSKSNDYTKKSDSIYVFKRNNDLTVDYVYSGEVTNTLYEKKYLNKKDKYSMFLDNNHPLIVITNNSITSNNEIIVIKDSYANCLIPFLVNHFKKIHVIDPRYYNLSISSYLKDNPNIKDGLILYNINTIGDDLGILGIE